VGLHRGSKLFDTQIIISAKMWKETLIFFSRKKKQNYPTCKELKATIDN